MNLQSHHELIILIQITNHHDLIMMTSSINKPCNSELQISRLPMRCSGRPCLTDLHGRCWTSTPGKLSYSVTATFCPWSINREKVCSPSLRGGKLLSSYLLLSLYAICTESTATCCCPCERLFEM
jgi:hypothetical protein